MLLQHGVRYQDAEDCGWYEGGRVIPPNTLAACQVGRVGLQIASSNPAS